MKVSLCHPSELSSTQVAQWRNLLRTGSCYDSPFYEPEYLQLLGKFRSQLEIALLEENSELVGIFAYERDQASRAKPPGVKLSDFQGPIFAEGFSIPLEELLTLCNLNSWRFDHQPVEEPGREKWTVRAAASRFINLSAGYDQYLVEQKTHTNKFTQTARKRRKLERETGPVVFQWHTTDDDTFDQLLKWKSLQRKETGTFDVLDWEWVVNFLQEIRIAHTEHLRGLLSTLTVDGQLAAVHLGMATPTAFHYWFPTYNPAVSSYSPGLILLLHMVEAAAGEQIQRFDFGKGEESYKQSFATGSFELGEGVVDFKPLSRAVRSSAYQIWEWVRTSPFYGPANKLKRWYKGQLTQSVMEQ